MNKKIEQVLKNYDLSITNNKAYGIIKGFETNIFYSALSNISPLKFVISTYLTPEQKEKVNVTLKFTSIKYLKYEFTNTGLIVGLNDFTAGGLAKKLTRIINKIYDMLIEVGATNHDYCPVCGNEINDVNTRKVDFNGATITLDEECINKLNTAIEQENHAFNTAPNNYLKGFLGILIGGVVGAIISFILYLVGVVASISSFVSILLGVYLYKKFGGKPNYVMIIMSFIVTLIFMLGTVFIIYIFVCNNLAIEEGFNLSGLEAFNFYMELESNIKAFTADMIMALVFTIIGSGCEIAILIKSLKRNNKLQ